MEKKALVEGLRALAEGKEGRSETARLREIFDEIERALAAGVSRAAVLTFLHQQGFTLTPKSFATVLYRLRKQRGAPAAKVAPLPPASKAPAQTKAEAISAAPSPPVSQPAEKKSEPPKTELAKKEEFPRRLTAYEQGLQVAEQFIKPETISNPLLRRIIDEQEAKKRAEREAENAAKQKVEREAEAKKEDETKEGAEASKPATPPPAEPKPPPRSETKEERRARLEQLGEQFIKPPMHPRLKRLLEEDPAKKKE